MRIPLSNPTRISRTERRKIRVLVDEVIQSGQLFNGPKSLSLREKLSELVGVRGVTLVGNGTDALEIAFRSLGVGRGAEVVTVANAGAYTTTAAKAVGATPRYVDISPLDLQMDPRSLERYLGSQSTKPHCVVVTHLYGQAAPVAAIREICDLHHIPLVEDCAQAIGGQVAQKPLGSFGDISTFSFYPTKNLGALGDGGAVLTDNLDLSSRVSEISQYGWVEKYVALRGGGRNSRMDEIQAGVLLHRLGRLRADNLRRREIYATYQDALGSMGDFPGSANEDFVAHLGIVLVGRRQSLIDGLNRLGIATGIHYPVLDFDQPAHSLRDRPVLPESENAVKKVLSLPLFPSMTRREQRIVVDSFRQVWEHIDQSRFGPTK